MFFRFVFLLLVTVIFAIPTQAFASDTPTTRDERLNIAISQQQLVLDDTNRQTIVSKCQNAQNSLTHLQEKTDQQIRLRIETYSNAQKELQAIKLRMGRQGVDASEIDLLIGKLQQGLDKLTLASNAYGASVDDITSIDCTQRPEAFVAGLVVARSLRAKMLLSASDLHKTIEDANENTFGQLRKRLTV